MASRFDSDANTGSPLAYRFYPTIAVCSSQLTSKQPSSIECRIFATQFHVKTTYNLTETLAKLPKLAQEPMTQPISRERLEGMLETLEILANPKAMKAIGADRAGRTKYVGLVALDA